MSLWGQVSLSSGSSGPTRLRLLPLGWTHTYHSRFRGRVDVMCPYDQRKWGAVKSVWTFPRRGYPRSGGRDRSGRTTKKCPSALCKHPGSHSELGDDTRRSGANTHFTCWSRVPRSRKGCGWERHLQGGVYGSGLRRRSGTSEGGRTSGLAARGGVPSNRAGGRRRVYGEPFWKDTGSTR